MHKILKRDHIPKNIFKNNEVKKLSAKSKLLKGTQHNTILYIKL